MVINELRGQPTVAFNQRLSNDLCDLIYFILLLRQLFFQLPEPGIHLLKLLEGRFV